jgi:hypothetical protein
LRYAEAETRWQRFLRRRRRSGRADLDLAKARRSRLRRDDSVQGGTMAVGAAGGAASSAYVVGSDPTPQGKYSPREVQRLGEEGRALPRKGGGYWFPIANSSDIQNAVNAYRGLTPREREGAGVLAWIIERARKLGVMHLLPKGWGEPVQKVGPRERE